MKNTLTIICGVPGSGKSTIAKALVDSGFADFYYEADMWMVENGEYKFSPEKLGYCHNQCFIATEAGLVAGKNVIVSNTSVSKWEREKYVQLAEKYDCHVQLIRVDGNFGSIHNVPEEKIDQMRQKLDDEWN